jgi:hypothetical protein
VLAEYLEIVIALFADLENVESKWDVLRISFTQVIRKRIWTVNILRFLTS